MNELITIVSEPTVCGYLQLLILLPVAAGILLLLIPDKFMTAKGVFALVISLRVWNGTTSTGSDAKFSNLASMLDSSGKLIKKST